MEKFVRFTKSHWKKLTIGSIPVLYGINYVKKEYQIFQQMRYVCNEVNLSSISKSNKVLVILNPTANKKRCEKMFKKYCEPVLHMAGYSVEVLKTRHVGHAKSLMETLPELPDVVVVAGGDGTSSEVVTGLLRRNEEMCPILFLPLGEKNEIAWTLMQNGSKDKSEYIKYLPQRVFTLIQDCIKYRPVIKYELIDNDKEHELRKPIYGLCNFSWGIFKNIEINKDKYWYFGIFKHYASALITFLSNKPNENITASIVSQPPCPGCKKCETPMKNTYWTNISKMYLNPQIQSQPVSKKKYDNCSTEKYYEIGAKQIDITCLKNSDSFYELSTDIIENILFSPMLLKNVIPQMNLESSTSIKSRTIELTPLTTQHQIYYIDGEGYDARPIKISFLPNALKYLS